MSYSTILDSEIDQDSPVDEVLLGKLRDNPIALARGLTKATSGGIYPKALSSYTNDNALSSQYVEHMSPLIQMPAGTDVIYRFICPRGGGIRIVGDFQTYYDAGGTDNHDFLFAYSIDGGSNYTNIVNTSGATDLSDWYIAGTDTPGASAAGSYCRSEDEQINSISDNGSVLIKVNFNPDSAGSFDYSVFRLSVLVNTPTMCTVLASYANVGEHPILVDTTGAGYTPIPLDLS
jgi:hypothetical protein